METKTAKKSNNKIKKTSKCSICENIEKNEIQKYSFHQNKNNENSNEKIPFNNMMKDMFI